MTESKLLGLSVGELTDEQRESLGLDSAKGGVLVRQVVSGPAKSAGLREGDVILLVDGEKVQGVDDFEARLKSLPQGRSVAILVHRNGGPLFLALRIPAGD
jgi:serine protease Do